jgi:hypothetical protein
MKRFASTLNCFDWMETTMRLPRPLHRTPSALLQTNLELPAHSRTRLLQGAGEAFFFYTNDRACRSDWRASLSLHVSCPIELHYPASPTLSRLGDLTGWSDTPSVDSSLDTRHNDAINPVDDWSIYSSTHLDPDPSTATVSARAGRAAKHKHTFVSCCAEHCEQTFLRKDHLTQHIRNKHQDLDTTFCCPIDGCTNRSLSLLQLLEYMQQPGHKRDVHFTPIKNAAEKPKCACGDGLIVSGRCKACGFHLA